jgi:hypothetical protein
VDSKSSTKGLSQIWLQFKEESRKYSKPVRTYHHLNMTISKKIPQNMATLGKKIQESYFAESQAPLLFWISKWEKESSPQKLMAF